MTEKELEKVPFHFVSHIAMEHEHCTTYSSEDGRLGICNSVPYKDGHPHGKPRTQYRIDDNVYNTKEAFLAALAVFPTARIVGIAEKGGKMPRPRHGRKISAAASLLPIICFEREIEVVEKRK